MTNEKKHNYFYKITNLINGKYYYGIHSTDNLNDGYKGSGKALKSSIKKHGIKNFTKEIIADYPTRHEVNVHEKLVVTMDLVLDENCYNLKTGGDNECVSSEETKEKIRQFNLGKKRPQWVKDKMKGRVVTDEQKEYLRTICTGKKLSEDHINKIKAALTGRVFSDEHKAKLKGCQKGKIISDEHRLAISNANKGRKLSEETINKRRGRNMGHTHTPTKPCIIDDVQFKSIKLAGLHHNLSSNTIINRLRSTDDKWKNWNYV